MDQLTLFGDGAAEAPKRKVRRKSRLEARNQRIVARFNALHKKGYRLDAICEKLEPEFGLAPDTIRKIVARY